MNSIPGSLALSALVTLLDYLLSDSLSDVRGWHALQEGVGPSTGNTVTENYVWRLNVEKRTLDGQV